MLRGVIRNTLFRFRNRTTRDYWEARHNQFAGDLAAVGHLGLSDDENLLDYETKQENLDLVLRKHLRPSSNTSLALDIGCGTGQMFPVLLAHGCHITGIDFSHTALRLAHATFPGTFLLVGDAKHITFRRKFTLITVIDVMFHILDNTLWLQSLHNLVHHLEPTGILIIQEHLINAASYKGIESHCHFRRRIDYSAALGSLNVQPLSETRYQLPSEGTYKDLLVLAHSDSVFTPDH